MNLLYDNINISSVLGSFLILFLGVFVSKRVSNFIDVTLEKRITLHQSALFKRALYYLSVSLFLVVIFKQMGVDIGVFIGAAGIFSVALSFASKTSASNLVSGIFLLIEHSFRVGDKIKVKNHIGTVVSIDLLSTKLISDENTLVRISNEELMKSEIINLSHCKNRRVDIFIDVPYSCDVEQTFETLLTIVKNNGLAQKKPASKVFISSFKDSSMELKLSTWSSIEDIETLNSSLRKSIVDTFKYEKMSLFKSVF